MEEAARVSGAGSPPRVTVRLKNRQMDWALALNPGLSVGEAYMEGDLTIEQGSLYDFLEIVARNFNSAARPGWMTAIERFGTRLGQHNPIGKAQRNVAHHYDLSDALYDIFLDRDRQYSCAYFTEPGQGLDTAQENKKRHLASKLFHKADCRILRHIAVTFNCRNGFR